MRDVHIFNIAEKLEALERQTTHNTLVLTQQLGQMNGRLAAIQRVLFGTRWNNLKVAWLLLWAPGKIQKMVDAAEQEIHQQMAAYAQAQRARHAEQQKKIRIIKPEEMGGLIPA